jgi:hypothetical protein
MAVTTTILRKSMPSFSMEGGAQAIVEEKISWDDIEPRLVELFGASFVSASSGIGFSVGLFAVHPDWSWFYASDCSVEPFFEKGHPADASSGYPDGAKITITYFSPCLNGNAHISDPTVSVGTYLTHEWELGSEIMKIKGKDWSWSTDPDTPTAGEVIVNENLPFGKIIPLKIHHLTWHNVLAANWTLLDSLQGTVNDDTFMGAAKHTLLFEGYTSGRRYTSDGNEQYDIRIVIAEKRIRADNGVGGTGVYGWNDFFKGGPAPQWVKICTTESEEWTYMEEDWSSVFVETA